jgi:hypothetical protein
MFSKEDIYIYIFSWKKVTDQATRLYHKVSEVCPNTWFINCDENASITDITNILQKDDSYYYGGQFETAVKHTPSGKIVGCIVGDVDPDAAWGAILENAVSAFNTGKIGIFAPNVDYTWHTSRKENLWGSLFEVENPDCTAWFIHPNVLSLIREIPYKMVSNLGWGIDTICCEEARRLQLHIARDYSVIVHQPRGTAYNQRLASMQMANLQQLYAVLVRCSSIPQIV